ncbi:MAG: DNA-binding response regulator [Frankiales bacterium]|jgi:DNA-binding response OmpR family regulator|nr:DNA-binding response regulator [Frankiales bacterium]
MIARLLVVEDDPDIGPSLVHALKVQGYDAQLAPDATTAERLAGEHVPDLVLLDLGLPDLDGVELCRRLRASLPSTVLVVLTARDSEIDVVIGLDAGADDYLTKPFRLAELLARLRAHLRRRTPTSAGDRLAVGHVVLDLAARRCLVDGTELALRPKELDLLSMLMSEAGSAVSRDRLMAEVWDEHWFGSTKTLDMHVSSLRRKLGDAGEQPERIATVRGFGYRYERELPASPAAQDQPGD